MRSTNNLFILDRWDTGIDPLEFAQSFGNRIVRGESIQKIGSACRWLWHGQLLFYRWLKPLIPD